MIKLEPYNSIGKEERDAADRVFSSYPLSGYLGGYHRGGYFVQKLEAEWRGAFGVRHAIACNSGTSGLLAASVAVGYRGPNSVAVTTPYTMSATAAAFRLLGADIDFGDIDPAYFCLNGSTAPINGGCKAIVVTNLFGHPARLEVLRALADAEKVYLIEDNAQAPFAMEGGRYAGTIGHIGVFSLNVHKHFHCGEGGIICTNDDYLAERCRDFINHGELAGSTIPGLNLRLTEISAAIASEQLKKAPGIIANRIEQAEFLTDCVKDLPFMQAPLVRHRCKHVYYCWAGLVHPNVDRDFVEGSLYRAGLPFRAGYVNPLCYLPAFDRYKRPCPVTDDVESRIILFENCGYNIKPDQYQTIRAIFNSIGDALNAMDRHRSGAFS